MTRSIALLVLFLAMTLSMAACEKRGTVVRSDDITVDKDAAGQVQYLPGDHRTATSAYAQYLQLKADDAGLRSAGGYFLETIKANVQQQIALIRRAQELDWTWDDLTTGKPVDLAASLKTAQAALTQG